MVICTIYLPDGSVHTFIREIMLEAIWHAVEVYEPLRPTRMDFVEITEEKRKEGMTPLEAPARQRKKNERR